MFVLEIIAGPYKGQAAALVWGEKLIVGRAPECQLCLADPGVSAAHVEVAWNDQGFSVFDLGSANGAFLNGQRLTARATFRVGDHLQVGGTLIALKDVELGREEDVQIQEPTKTGILSIQSGSTQVMKRITIPSAKTGAAGGSAAQQQKTILPTEGLLALGKQRTQVAQSTAARLADQTVAGAATLKQRVQAAPEGAKALVHRDERFDPFWSLPITIGREHGSGIVLDDLVVSLRHAVIDFREGHYLIRDVGSSNGVFVNAKRVVEQRLADGDVLLLGAHTILVVLGERCLGLEVQPPLLGDKAPRSEVSSTRLGLLDQPLAGEAPKKRKRKAAELVWYGTSDLERGVYRARSALIALILGVGLTFWMLAQGDSHVLAGSPLSAAHESPAFLEQLEANHLDRCTACHVGAGQVSTLKCLDCHPNNRPLEEHAQEDVPCAGCHLEHRGADYRPALAALQACTECHGEPHQSLKRTKPRLVATFTLDAPADVPFHLHHQEQGIGCLACHGSQEASVRRGIRGACGQCHAPDHPTAAECGQCHRAHPDRAPLVLTATLTLTETPPPRFATEGLLYTFGLLFVSFVAAALLPRRRAAPERANTAVS
ncbi:MAG: FHA domain-containing protein [Deltaproteobacteria bacterium]|nr:FHA domain-containing protein [Deltaproteobacteria bacterium]